MIDRVLIGGPYAGITVAVAPGAPHVDMPDPNNPGVDVRYVSGFLIDTSGNHHTVYSMVGVDPIVCLLAAYRKP